VQEVIGIDFKTFSQLVYQNTNASLQFLTATDTNRKKFLIELLSLEKYVDLFELFKAASRDISMEVNALDSQISTIEKWLHNNKLTDTTVLPMLNLEIDTEEEEKEFRFLTKEIENISEKNKKISKNNSYKELLKQIDIDEARKCTISKKESYDDLQSETGSLNGVVAGSQKLLVKLEKLGDHCPTCEQAIDPRFKEGLIDSETKKITEAKEKQNEIETRISEIKRNNRDYDNARKIERDWEDMYRSIDRTLPVALLDKNELDERLARVQDDLGRRKSEMERISKENEQRTKRNTRIQVIQEQTDELCSQLEKANEKLKSIGELSSNLEVLKKSFSTNGLIAYKIENLVKELEELANHYLAELSDGRFTLEFVVTNDKLNVQVTDNGNVVDILALSSGELARVNTATLIAIRKLMSSISKSRINVLFLDEVINVLDETGREKIVEVLLQEDLNTYIVSHGWSHPLLEKIEVIKCDNVSKLEY
jgi:DNA repair exonuclease SbcCD ATPase subunit